MHQLCSCACVTEEVFRAEYSDLLATVVTSAAPAVSEKSDLSVISLFPAIDDDNVHCQTILHLMMFARALAVVQHVCAICDICPTHIAILCQAKIRKMTSRTTAQTSSTGAPSDTTN